MRAYVVHYLHLKRNFSFSTGADKLQIALKIVGLLKFA